MWVKFHVSLLDNDAFRRLSSDERLTFALAIAIAAKQKQHGALAIRGVGPMTVAEICAYTGLSPKRQKAALDGLVQTSPFLIMRDGAYVVEHFDEKAGVESERESHRERQRRYRARKRDGCDASRVTEVTNVTQSQSVTDKEEEVDQEVDQLASLADSAREVTTVTRATRSPAFAFCQWMLDAGIAGGVISAHFALDPFAWCSSQIATAETLLATYGEPAVRARALRFFAVVKARKIRRVVSVVSLAAVWDWCEMRADEPVQDDAFLAELRAAEVG